MPRNSASRRPTITIVGPGNLGRALALTLSAAGYKVKSIAIRPASKRRRAASTLSRRVGAQLIRMGKQPLDGDIVWITVPDDAIAAVARHLARSQEWKGKVVFHSSGALTSDELEPLRSRGARVASVHPMMTFVHSQVPEMRGVAFGLEGDAAAMRIAKLIVERLGGGAFVIRPENKVLYHAFGAFASPLVIALLVTMEQVGLAAGLRKREIKRVMSPLMRQTLQNYLQGDAASAFSGPLIRGDVATVRKHLLTLQGLREVNGVYVALARAALRFLPVQNREPLMRLLEKARRFSTKAAHAEL